MELHVNDCLRIMGLHPCKELTDPPLLKVMEPVRNNLVNFIRTVFLPQLDHAIRMNTFTTLVDIFILTRNETFRSLDGAILYEVCKHKEFMKLYTIIKALLSQHPECTVFTLTGY